jgi:SAM-dependent methyltransferase
MQEGSVRARYSEAARGVEAALCCPVTYDASLLDAIPPEVLERDYGCGDPTPYVRPGDTVLDLGSGGGKLCYIAAQLSGPQGRVIGVDCNADMLALARRHRETVAQRLGYANVEFRCGLIQDLRLDLDLLAAELEKCPVRDREGWLELRSLEEQLRRDRPMIGDKSIDCVLSNCVLNLVRTADRIQLFAELHRVLKPGGRAAISDIVADEDVPEVMRNNPELWSGCIAGAFREDLFLQAFEDAGFHGIRLAKREPQPWRVAGGIAFRAVTVLAYKPAEGTPPDGPRAIIYRGPFKKVEDDFGQVFARGRRTPVSGRTFRLLQKEPFTGLFESVETPAEVLPQAGSSCRGPDSTCH